MQKISTLGERVLLRRRALGLTQAQLGAQCDCSYQVICALERGRATIIAERVALLARALNVSADYLLGLREDYGRRTR